MTQKECEDTLKTYLILPRPWGYVRDERRDQHLNTLIEIAEITKNPQAFGFIHFIQSGKYYDKGEFYNGYQEAQKALSYGEECGDWWTIAMGLNNIGVFYGQQNNTITSFDYYWRAVNCIQEAGVQDAPLLYLLYGNIGECMSGVREYTKALKYFSYLDELKIPENFVHTPMNNAFTNLSKIECYYMLNRYEEAQDLIAAQEALEKEHEDTRALHYSTLVWKFILLYQTGFRGGLEPLREELLEFDIRCVCILSLKILCTFLYENKEFDFFQKANAYLEADSKKEKNLELELSAVHLWLRYYEEIGEQQNFQEKCAQFYHLQCQKQEQEFMVRSDSLNTIVSVSERAQHQLEAKRREELLRKKSQYDELTGIPNRYYLKEYCELAFSKAHLEQTPISVEILDIDCFKQLNDHYGHLDGDKCLKTIGSEIMKSLGEDDFCARYGGDEFVIIRCNCTDLEIQTHMENLREHIMQLKIPNILSSAAPVATISQGVYNGIPKTADSFVYYLKLADQALYQSKKNSKNSLLIFKSE